MTNAKNEADRPKRELVRLDMLFTDPDVFQYREVEITNAHVEDLARLMRNGKDVDPMKVWRKSDGNLIVIDGHHRLEAYRQVGERTTVPALVYDCEERDARLIALQDNARARLPMTATEKTNAAWRLVTCEHDYSKREICRATGASDGTVAKMRRVLRLLEETEQMVPNNWYQAMRAAKGIEEELDEDLMEERNIAQAQALDDKIGKELGRAAHRNPEAVRIFLEKRLGNRLTELYADYWQASDDDDEFPF